MSHSLIKSTAIALLEKTINSALQLDPATLKRLGKLSGKTIRISCTKPSLSFLLIPHRTGVMLQTAQSASANSPADCHIKGDSVSLLTLITATNKTDALFNSNLTLSGNTDTAQELQAILSGLDIDWEEKLSHWVGDIAAHQLGNQTRSLLRWSQQTLNSLILDTEEYLHEESRSMPPRLELESFYQDIEHLTVETDRIAAKLQRIKDNMRPHTKIKQPTTEDTQS